MSIKNPRHSKVQDFVQLTLSNTPETTKHTRTYF